MDGNCKAGGNGCACGGTGPAVTRFLETLAPAGNAGDHFRKARVEFLKGLRDLVDQRIQSMEHRMQEPKGSKISVD